MAKLLALSIHQPWAWAIVNGHKSIMNSSRPLLHRGQLVIHASKSYGRNKFEKARDFCESKGLVIPPSCDLPRGELVGTVKVINCTYKSTDIPPWGISLHYHSEFRNPIAFEVPIPFRGSRGLFEVEVPPDYVPDYSGFLEGLVLSILDGVEWRDPFQTEFLERVYRKSLSGKLRGDDAYFCYRLLSRNLKLVKEAGICRLPDWSALVIHYGEVLI